MVPLVIFTLPRNGLRLTDRNKIDVWLRNRLNNPRVKMVIEET